MYSSNCLFEIHQTFSILIIYLGCNVLRGTASNRYGVIVVVMLIVYIYINIILLCFIIYLWRNVLGSAASDRHGVVVPAPLRRRQPEIGDEDLAVRSLVEVEQVFRLQVPVSDAQGVQIPGSR